jgi:hypothetical protein
MSASTRKAFPARLWVLLAREAPVGVVFRRGPSKHVMLIKWNTREDSFEHGQWFRGRIYERRSDLSPDGNLLIYFAANQKPPMISWTAISKPPYFTALALWPKGDCWNGGGWFVDNSRIRLNHPVGAGLHPDFHPGPIKIVGFGEFKGEDDSVWRMVLSRDGWTMTAEGNSSERRGREGYIFDPPEQWRKPHPKRPSLKLEMSIVAVGRRNSPWYQIRYRLLDSTGSVFDLGLADWADWDHRGHLVFSKSGCLFRQSLPISSSNHPIRIADFNDRKFEEVRSPGHARRW